jgi:hypothetical protein
MSTAEILKAIDATPARSKGKLMAKLHQRLEDFYDVQSVAEAHKNGEWVPFEQVKKELEARHAKVPSVEADVESGAVYLRFKRTPIVKTLDHSSPTLTLTVDFDANAEVVGVEVLMLDAETIAKLERAFA